MNKIIKLSIFFYFLLPSSAQLNPTPTQLVGLRQPYSPFLQQPHPTTRKSLFFRCSSAFNENQVQQAVSSQASCNSKNQLGTKQCQLKLNRAWHRSAPACFSHILVMFWRFFGDFLEAFNGDNKVIFGRCLSDILAKNHQMAYKQYPNVAQKPPNFTQISPNIIHIPP